MEQVMMTNEQKDSLNEKDFDEMLKTDKKQVVKQLAIKMAASPDIKDIWVNSQVEGIKPLIEWEDDKLKGAARDFFSWD